MKKAVVEPSKLRGAQVLVIINEQNKIRKVADYIQTVNQNTQLDAYHFPNIEDQVNEIVKNPVFSTINLIDAFYKIPIQEGDSDLYQRKRVPFGVKNGVPCFQRIFNFIAKHEVEKTSAFLDNVMACRKNMEEHDKNLRKLLEKDNMKLNHDENNFFFCYYHYFLGYQTSGHEIRPDQACLKILRNMPPQSDIKVKKKLTRLFSYFSK